MLSLNPFLAERLRDHFADKRTLRSYKIYTASLCVIIFATWPSNPISYYLQFSSKPITLATTFMVMFLFVIVLSMAEEYSRSSSRNSLADWIVFSPVHIGRVLWGRFQFFILHSAFLLILPAPLILTAAAASGLLIKDILAAGSVVLMFCVFTKVLILMLELIFRRMYMRTVCMCLFLIFAVLLSARYSPAANPILAVQLLIGKSSRSGDALFFTWTDTLVLYGTAMIAAWAVSTYKLIRLRKEAEVSR
ncbi:MAG: hypothetical protein HN368_17605 [Spirochaetales bacterium]|jgi:hypothetical protein|nr:hypothetical protein [Spirochaetales bacterium]